MAALRRPPGLGSTPMPRRRRSPPISPADYLFGSPPASLDRRRRVGTLLRAAMRLWATSGRCGRPAAPAPAARLPKTTACCSRASTPVINVAASGQVDSTRLSGYGWWRTTATLIHLALQEWLLSAPETVRASDDRRRADPGRPASTSQTLGANHHCVICTADAISAPLACGGTGPPRPRHRQNARRAARLARRAGGAGSSPPAPIETFGGGQSATLSATACRRGIRVAARNGRLP